MINGLRVLTIIPARGGSKRLPGKNIKALHGKPLIEYAIAASLNSKYVDRTVVSTDDESIAEVARRAGASVPFMRPAELASDDVQTLPVLTHAALFCAEEGESFDIVVLIQPTVPGVRSEDVDALLEKMSATGTCSAVTVCEIADRPEWMFRLDEEGKAAPYTKQVTARTQDMEPLYRINGAVYASLSSTLLEGKKIIDPDSVSAVIMPRERSTDIDTVTDFVIAEALLKKDI